MNGNQLNDILKNHFSKYLEDDLNLGFAPCFIGHEKCSPKKPVAFNSSEKEHSFHLILSGTGYLVNGNTVRRLVADDVFYIPPKNAGSPKKIYYYPDKKDPWEYIWVNFVGKDVPKLLKCANLTEENNYYSMQTPIFLRQQWIEMINIARTSTKRNVSFFLPFVIKFFAEIAEERKLINRTLTNKEKTVKQIISFIEKSYLKQDFSISKIAENFFYSISYISRIFKEITAMSPTEYVLKLRMLHAKDLLRLGEYSVSEIAYIVGYSSPFYFSKEFKKYYGVSPSKFV